MSDKTNNRINPVLKDIDDYYTNIRWNNQFHYMGTLPTHLQNKIDEHKTALERYESFTNNSVSDKNPSKALVMRKTDKSDLISKVFKPDEDSNGTSKSVMARYSNLISQKPQWHAPWKLIRVINGHLGWVRCIAMDPVDNEWFVTGSNDTTLKVWDLASGKLKVTLSGHVMSIRDVVVSERHPYMFSASEDKLVKCWDLEKNQAIRDFYGHLSGVHTVDIHPTQDLIVTGGRDSVVKIWDIRSRKAVKTLVGHKAPIQKVKCLPVDPQVISCSNDSTIRLWDIISGKTIKILTHHKRNVRAMTIHPTEFSMATASTDDVRSWKLPEGQLLTNFESQNSGIINTLSINQDNVIFAGGDNGTLSFYDYKSGHLYQSLKTTEIPGSMESERGILTSTFDGTGLRLLTGETDKSIKIWKYSENATPESDPGLPWNPVLSSQRF